MWWSEGGEEVPKPPSSILVCNFFLLFFFFLQVVLLFYSLRNRRPFFDVTFPSYFSRFAGNWRKEIGMLSLTGSCAKFSLCIFQV